MADTLVGAVIARAQVNIPGVTGGWWSGEAPEGGLLPHVIVRYAVDEEEPNTGDIYVERGTLSWEVFAAEAAPCENLAKQIDSKFGRQAEKVNIPLAASAGRILSIARKTRALEPQQKRAKDGAVVYTAAVSFLVQVQGVR